VAALHQLLPWFQLRIPVETANKLVQYIFAICMGQFVVFKRICKELRSFKRQISSWMALSQVHDLCDDLLPKLLDDCHRGGTTKVLSFVTLCQVLSCVMFCSIALGLLRQVDMTLKARWCCIVQCFVADLPWRSVTFLNDLLMKSCWKICWVNRSTSVLPTATYDAEVVQRFKSQRPNKAHGEHGKSWKHGIS